MKIREVSKTRFANLLLHWVAPLLVLGCAGYFVYAMGTQKRPERKKPPVRKSISVDVIRAEPHEGTLDIITSGVAIPYREVALAARVGGEVQFKSDLLSPGRVVNQGDLLLRIDPADYELQIAQLENQVAMARVNLNRIKVDRENTQRLLAVNHDLMAVRQRDVHRLTRLQTANAASAAEIDSVELSMLTAMQQTTTQENNLRTYDNQTESLEMTLKLTQLQLRRAQLDLERTEIRAPFTGVIIANHVEQGGTISTGSAIATIEDTSEVEVRTNLRRKDMDFLQGGGYEMPQVPVTIEHDHAGQTYCWSGVLSRQDGLGIDERTRTMPVRIRVDNPACNSPSKDAVVTRSLALLRGMFVRVRFHCSPNRPLVVVPESVIRPGKTVWMMRAGELQIEPIRIARIEAGKAYINSDGSSLTADALIISSPVPNARPGLPVSLQNRVTPQRKQVALNPTAVLPTRGVESPIAAARELDSRPQENR